MHIIFKNAVKETQSIDELSLPNKNGKLKNFSDFCKKINNLPTKGTVILAPNSNMILAPNSSIILAPNSNIILAPNSNIILVPNSNIILAPNSNIILAPNSNFRKPTYLSQTMIISFN